MKITKKIISLSISALMLISFALPVCAEKKTDSVNDAPASEKVLSAAESEKSPENNEDKKFTKEDAEKVALTAAKAKYATEGVSGDIAGEATVTKMKYNKDSGEYSVTVRAKRIYKFKCDVSVKNVLGMELGVPENTEFTEQGKIGAFFGQGFEKISWFFIRILGKDEA